MSEEDNFVGLFLPVIWVLFSDKSLCKEELNKKINEAEKWLKAELFLSIKPRSAKQEITVLKLNYTDPQYSH